MTAASPVCSPSSSASSQSPPACLPSCTSHLRRARALRLQTRLPLRSAPGVWLLLGVVVVLVGMSVAVAGYVSAAPRPVGGRGSTHAERMKLSGPVVMGVGLFIFICAATLLYENRDREVLRRRTSDDLEDLKGDGWDDDGEERWADKDGQRGPWDAAAGPAHHTLPLSEQTWSPLPPPPPPPPPHANSNNISSSSTPPHAGGGDAQKEEEEREGGSTLLAQVLHHQEPSPRPPSPPPSVHSDSCNSSEIHFNVRTDSPPPPPLH